MSESPNVVLVSIDSLRADHCGFLGDDRDLTSTMDDLARTGVAFETAVAPGPQTFSSMPAVFTGSRRQAGGLDAYPGESHWQRRMAAIDDHLDRFGSLAERLGELGYETAGFSPNPWTSTSSGFDRGFDHFPELVGETSEGRLRQLVGRVPGIDETSKPVELTLDMLTGSSFFASWEGYYDEIEAVRSDLSEPYFLWVFLMDTHYPFLPSGTHRQEQSLWGMLSSTIRSEGAMRGHSDTLPDDVCASMARSYRDSVRSVDAFLEQLRGDLAPDDPALIVHSDHGESFGEHGNYGHHHRQLYEENTHVPYFVHNAGVNETVEKTISLDTIPDVALSIARTGTFDPGALTENGVVTTSECGTNQAFRDLRFKYVDHQGEQELFDLERDPAERIDISENYPEQYASSQSRIDRSETHSQETVALSRAARTIAQKSEL